MARKTTNLDDFKGIRLNMDLAKIIKENAEEATETLHSINDWKMHRSTKSYSAGWIMKMKVYNKDDVYAQVYNKTNWQLTWLLENGHLIVNKRGGVGWSAPRKHIEPTYDKQVQKLIDDMKNIDIKADFE